LERFLWHYFFLAVLAASLKSLAEGAPLLPTLRIFSPEPALIRAFLAAMLAYKPGLVATTHTHLLSWFSFRSSHLSSCLLSIRLSFFLTLSCVWELLVFDHWHDYFLFFGCGLDCPALDRAIAIACFCGLPAFISLRILVEIVFCDVPDLSGILILSIGYTELQNFLLTQQ